MTLNTVTATPWMAATVFGWGRSSAGLASNEPGSAVWGLNRPSVAETWESTSQRSSASSSRRAHAQQDPPFAEFDYTRRQPKRLTRAADQGLSRRGSCLTQYDGEVLIAWGFRLRRVVRPSLKETQRGIPKNSSWKSMPWRVATMRKWA